MSILSVIQKTSDRLFQRARRELVYLRSNMPNCSADKFLEAIPIRGVSETPPCWSCSM